MKDHKWMKLKRVTACLRMDDSRRLEEALLDAAHHDAKWGDYAAQVHKHRDFLRAMFRDNRELLYSQFDSGMRARAKGLTEDEVDARVLAGKL